MISNRKLGNGFESELCEILYANGFWAHNMKQDASGQPADVIAVKGNFHCLIDCKVVSTKAGFAFSRWEDNQRNAMGLFKTRGYCDSYLALKLPNGEVRMLSARTVTALEENDDRRSIPLSEMKNYTDSFDEWMGYVDGYNQRWRP